MYQKVLFPTDFSLPSQRITECIGQIPGIREVVLLHVVDARSPSKTGTGSGEEIEHVKDLMTQNEKIIENFGLAVQTNVDVMEKTVDTGTIGSRILKTADKENVSMIIMGARGKSLHDLFLGSVSTYVLHHASVPLLLVKSPHAGVMPSSENIPNNRPFFSRILIPTDFSAHSADIIRFVKATQGVDTVILLHVVHAETNDSGHTEYINNVTMKLGAIRDELTQSGFTVRDYIRAGYPPDEINLLAEEEHATLIAISPRGEGWLRGLKELLIGSTTYAVVRRADRPVLVVRSVKKT
ncbi:MAG: universal stress protein [Methanomicrobiales archaeon]|nr:universal stress protein [Methanomicrobiales archaeon]